MKTTEVTLRFLIPEDGLILRHKEDKTILSEKVSLSVHDSLENWEEVNKETAEREKQEIEQEMEKELKMLEEESKE